MPIGFPVYYRIGEMLKVQININVFFIYIIDKMSDTK